MGLIGRIRIATAGSGASMLKLLRTMPAQICASKGFFCRGAALSSAIGGTCTLRCEQDDGAYRIEVAAGGGMDFFIPFAQGAARYCDVPKGAPDGTLVVTFPMNGCALEVQSKGRVNRFFHDSDGRSMTHDRQAKVRIEADHYEGAGAAAAARFGALPGPMSGADVVGQNFEHTLICVKKGDLWNVYQTAIVVSMDISGQQPSYRYSHVKQGPPVHLGVFAD